MDFFGTGAMLGMMGDAVGAAYSAKESRLASKRAWRYYKRSLTQGPSFRVEGLRQAGLNPILAATGGFPGAGATIPAMPGRPPDFAGSARAGAEAQRVSRRTNAEVGLLRDQAGQARAAASYQNAQEATQRYVQAELSSRAAGNLVNAARSAAETRKTIAEIPGVVAMEQLYKRFPQMRYLKEFGAVGGGMATTLDAGSKILNSAKQLLDDYDRMRDDEARKSRRSEGRSGGSSW